MTDNDDRLDRLLAMPLAPVDDAGFSVRVMTQIGAPRAPAWLLEEITVLVSLGLVVAFVASTRFSDWIADVGYDLGTSLPFAAAVLSLALTLVFARPFAE